MVKMIEMDKNISLSMKKVLEMKYKHYFKCSGCGSVSSYLSKYELYDKKRETFETFCLCGINSHIYLESKVLER